MATSKEGHEEDMTDELLEKVEEEDTNEHGSFSHKARSSKDYFEPLRLVVLGSDDIFINETCATIIPSPKGENDKRSQGCTIGKGRVGGRQVSVVKTPSLWLAQLKSHLILSEGVKSMQSDIMICNSLIFPGPHAFLLVLENANNSGKEHLLLRALTHIYGREVLDYCMVLFKRDYGTSDIVKNKCIKMCRNRFHILQNAEDSVLNLFDIIDKMAERDDRNRYFAKHFNLLEKAKICFQKESDAAREQSLKTECLETAKTIKDQMNEILAEFQRDTLKDDIYRELETLKVTVNHLRRDLKDFSDREDQLKLNNKELRSEIDDLKSSDKRLEINLLANIMQKNTELQIKETELFMREKDLESRERNLTLKDRDVCKRKSWSGVFQSEQFIGTKPAGKCGLNEGDGAESSDGDSHIGGSDAERCQRNSLPYKKPYL